MRPDDDEMEALWSHLRDIYAVSGVRQFFAYDDVDVLDPWALPVKLGKVLLPQGPFGWAPEHVALVLDSPAYKPLERAALVPPSGRELDVVVSFPGGLTYGHWFVDILPRIELVLQSFSRTRLAFILPGPLPDWTGPFLAPYGFGQGDVIEIASGSYYHSAELLLPSLGRNTDYLPPNPHLRAFNKLRGHWLGAGPSRPGGSRLLVRHTPQTSAGLRSTLTNFDALEQALERQGFVTICPAEMTHGEQVAAFAGAAVVVGEDSSALHNIVYSTGVRLVVINSVARKNLLHLSLAKLLGHRCHYVFCAEHVEGGFVCDVQTVLGLVD